jgi:dipeptidase
MGCDTLVALPAATADGVTLFAKNSDRPPRECQRVVQLPHARHPAGARVRCQYVDIPQVEETAAVLGSQPYWLWGFEHGVNEHRVAIGNEMVFAREPLGATGLLGMDLVRLGLERGRSAEAALAVMTTLLETHGQGGSGQPHLDWPYHNAFLIADPSEAWVLETSARHWAARRVAAVGNISNGIALKTDWERGSADLTTFAVEQGWWPAGAGRVDFAAAYRDESTVPPNLWRERCRRAGSLLAEARAQISPAALRTILRDHYDGAPGLPRRAPDDPLFFTLCMHADPLDNTTAAIVARLPIDPAALATTWVCLGSPCTGVFMPCYLDGTVPAGLARGEDTASDGSPWWRMRELLTLVERDPPRFAPLVRARWDELETRLAADSAAIEDEATALRRGRRGDEAARTLTAFMERTLGRILDTCETLVREIDGRA